MSNIITIKDGIKSILEAIVDGTGTREIVVVYKYPESKPTGFPYAIIDYKGDTSSELTNREDLVEYEFEVRLIQEKLEDFKGRADAEETTEDRSFKINKAFRLSNKLDLADVIRVRPIRTVKSYIEGATRIQLSFTLLVLVKETIAI